MRYKYGKRREKITSNYTSNDCLPKRESTIITRLMKEFTKVAKYKNQYVDPVRSDQLLNIMRK